MPAAFIIGFCKQQLSARGKRRSHYSIAQALGKLGTLACLLNAPLDAMGLEAVFQRWSHIPKREKGAGTPSSASTREAVMHQYLPRQITL